LVLFALNELEMPWTDFLVSLGLQEEQEVNQQPEEQRTRFPRKLGFLLNLGVHPKPPNEPKRRPYLKKGGPDQRKKDQLLHQGRKFLEGN
jgi:hypothetical protein